MISISDLKENIYSIAIGLRFNPTFAIGDNLGKIADKILYSKGSYFNSAFFPLIDSGINEVALRDNTPTRHLYISTTDIILEVKKNTDIDFNVSTLEGEYEKQILKSVLATYQVRDIQRIGYLSKYKIVNEDLSESLCRKLGVDANNISMRFQKNYAMPEAMQKKAVNDYCSNIYTIVRKSGSDEIIIQSDYQIYFNPFLDTPEDIQYSIFLNEKNKFNEKILPDWLNSYLSK